MYVQYDRYEFLKRGIPLKRNTAVCAWYFSISKPFPHSQDNNNNRNHVYLAPSPNDEGNDAYVRPLVKLCERCMQHGKKVQLLTQHNLSGMLEKPQSLHELENWLIVLFKDIESAPRRIIELFDCAARPDIIIFDINSMVSELIRRESSSEMIMRHMAKCSASFCHYLGLLHVSNLLKIHDIVVILPVSIADPYLTSEQIRILIGLNFSGYQIHNNFDYLSRCVCPPRLQSQKSTSQNRPYIYHRYS